MLIPIDNTWYSDEDLEVLESSEELLDQPVPTLTILTFTGKRWEEVEYEEPDAPEMLHSVGWDYEY